VNATSSAFPVRRLLRVRLSFRPPAAALRERAGQLIIDGSRSRNRALRQLFGVVGSPVGPACAIQPVLGQPFADQREGVRELDLTAAKTRKAPRTARRPPWPPSCLRQDRHHRRRRYRVRGEAIPRGEISNDVTAPADQRATPQVRVRDPDVLRLWFVFWLVMVGIAAVFAAFAVGLTKLDSPDGPTVVALVSAVTTAVGTLVGFVAGQKLGAAGKERADNRADAVQERLDAVVETNGNVLREAAGRHPNLFPHLRQTT